MASKRVQTVQYGILTPDEIRNFSSVLIHTPSNRGNQTIEGTPYDLRLGALENGDVCETCGENNHKCPGHFGHIELAEPCYNPEYINTVLNIFKCICIECINPRMSENVVGTIANQKRSARFKAYRAKAETLKHCHTCKEPLPQFFIDKYMIKYFYEDKKKAVPLTAREAQAILMQVTNDTMRLLGFNHDLSMISRYTNTEIELHSGKNHVHEVRPEAYILSVLPVIPTCTRPWINKGSDRKDDDITGKLDTILKLNAKLSSDANSSHKDKPVKGRRKNGKLSESDRKKIIEDLHSNIRTLFDNSKEAKTKNNNRQHKGFRERLGTKEGHIQSNIAGKRVDYTARTVVVGGGTLIPMGWIGVPEVIAQKLTIPELIVAWNKDFFEKLLQEGKINAVKRQGNIIRVAEATNNGEKKFIWKGHEGLRLYDIVERQVRDGDWVIVNRQPTLRIESMQGFQVKVMKGEYAYRFPLGATRAFNMDFDGDEINIHVAQSQGARIECSTISRCAYQIVSPQNNAPVMGCVQNTLIAHYILTETFSTPEDPRAGDKKNTKPSKNYPDGTVGYETFLDKEDFDFAIQTANISTERVQDLLKRALALYPEYIRYSKSSNEYKIKKKIPGKLLTSIVFPRTFSWERKTDINEKLPVVIIKNGIITPDSGPICKKTIGGVGGAAIHALWKISPDTACNVISELQFIGSAFIERYGFSMGISDILPTRMNEVKSAINEALIKCEMINNSGKDMEDKEVEINSVLNEASGIAPILAKTSMNKGDRNALVIMQKSGAKGSVANNGQISGFVSQQNIDGKRMQYTISNKTRTLPHFVKNDNSPEARGFVKHSYLEGLTHYEAWFHAAAGRRGVVDTALKSVTWETKIIIDTSKGLKTIQIGEWIDALIENNENVEYYEKRNMEYLSLDVPVHIANTDSKGNISWGEVIAVTRHDPGDKLYKITTLGGRSVIVTASKSLLIWNEEDEEFVQTLGGKAKEGDFVPVTCFLPEPESGIITKLDMSKYIPKEEYTYGSEMFKFKKQYEKDQLSNGRSPNGWWEKHKNKTFIIPFQYIQKAKKSLSRQINKVKPEFIQPFPSILSRAKIPEFFEFDRQNGFFIGLYLAEGNSSIKEGTVCITNNDKELQEEVKKWFERYNMSYHTNVRTTDWGSATMIRGCSVIMAKFLITWLGSSSYTKRIPDEIFSAPEEFIKGLLDGYISGDGSVKKRGDVVVTSASEELIQGISLLCSRLGIFGKITKYQITKNNFGTEKIAPTICFAIRSNFAHRFAKLIGCTHKAKFQKMRTTGKRLNNSRPVFRKYNDVILDKIVSIEKVDPKDHPHVYDITVPSTENFCLANGLHVVDTSDSGYIQKKIGKKIEDCKAYEDGSIRDVNGSIIQFMYGGDGFNAKELIACKGIDGPIFCDAKAIASYLNSEAEYEKEEGQDVGKLKIMTKEEIDVLCSFIQAGSPYIQTEITERVSYNIRTILRSILSTIKIYESKIPNFCRAIKDDFEEAKVKRGYMAGLIASSAMGEPTTQLSVDKDEKIIFMIKYPSGKKQFVNGKIGCLVDQFLDKFCSKVQTENIANGKSDIGYPDKADIYVNTVNPKTLKTEWKKLQEVSRHPANGKMVKVTTSTGRIITTTLSHSHLKRDFKTGEIVPVRGDKLEIGDFIPVCSKMNSNIEIKEINAEEQVFPLDFDMGWLFGAYLSEGRVDDGQIAITNISKHFEERCKHIAKLYGCKVRTTEAYNSIQDSKKVYQSVTHHISGLTNLGRYLVKTCGLGSKNKKVPSFAYFAPKKFISGLLRGYFDGDGNVSSDKKMIRVHSISRDLIETIALLLSRFEIFGSIIIEKNERETPLICLSILRKHVQRFLENIGSDFPEKKKALKEIVDYVNRTDIHSSREDIDVVPGIGKDVSEAAYPLKLPGYSRTYKRHEQKAYLGKETLRKYVNLFEENGADCIHMDKLRTALGANIIWDKIKTIEILKDPKTLVYDLGVTGNHTFMLQSGLYTHNTLNSLDYKELVYVRKGSDIILKPIGQFIDEIIENSSEDVIQRLPNKQIYIEIKNKNYEVTSVDEDGKMHWKPLEAITRHLPGGKLIKVKTRYGREVIATKGFSFLTRKKNKITATLGSDLKIGDRVPIMAQYPDTERIHKDYLTKNYGIRLGLGAMLGYFASDIPYWFLVAPLHFINGFLIGIFGELCEGRIITSTNRNFILGVCELLTNFNFYGEISETKDETAVKIVKVNSEQDVFYDDIISIEEVECSTEWVYDFTVADTRNFSTFGGFQVRDTFHSTGMATKDVTMGVPRLKEILNVTKKPSKPSTTVFVIDEELHSESETENSKLERISEIANSFTEINVENFLKGHQMQYLMVDDEKPKYSPIPFLTYEQYEKKWWVTFAEKLGQTPKFEPSSWVILLEFDIEKLYTYGISLEQIAECIENEAYSAHGDTLCCIVSPDIIGQIEVYLNFADIKQYTDAKLDFPENTATRQLINNDNIDYFTAREVALNLIKKTKVQGIKGIEKVYVNKNNTTGEWFFDTKGLNLMEILARNDVDKTRTISDDVWEIYNIFGIESVRKFLIGEITRILSFDGTYINPRHISLLVDAMCHTGIPTGVNRDGISRDVGPIAKGMFEKAVDNFAEAASFAEHDDMEGVASAVMFGTIPKIGTGTVKVLDAGKIEERKPVKMEQKKRGALKKK